ncbi:MAG TPA: efflux RND transporter periplasmic adaptor subunit [Chitinivibrionales bacterium]|nr:efflux RND transporter periplasmic adaptor subunit [Chitinivibrionales bacterium]
MNISLRTSRHAGKAAVFTAAIAAVALSSCMKKDPSGFRAGPVPVLAAAAQSRTMPLVLREIGSVEAINSVAITSRVGGQLVHVAFKEGQNVKKNDVLFRIDPGPYEAALRQAAASLSRDSAAMVNAESEEARYKGLVAKDFVTKEQYDAAVSTAAESRAMVEADRASVKNARLNLGYCTIVSPISGRTGNLLVTQGNLVTANGASPLVTVNQIAPIYVRFSVPEANLEEVRRDARAAPLAVRASLPNDSTAVPAGTLTFIDNAVDQATGTVLLKATFPNENRALWPGQFVNVSLVLGNRANAVVVPSSAVQTGQQGQFVFVIMAGDTAQVRPVTAGVADSDMTVIEKGVSLGERVVTDGVMMLKQGSKVTVKTGLMQPVAQKVQKK